MVNDELVMIRKNWLWHKWCTLREFAWGGWGNRRKIYQDSWCFASHLNLAPPDCKLTAFATTPGLLLPTHVTYLCPTVSRELLWRVLEEKDVWFWTCVIKLKRILDTFYHYGKTACRNGSVLSHKEHI